ncbi:MAG: hypothetical protein IPJ85_16240 [Flavobacteriales bacterium]|nr:hypothetical protein [Flavobacteriales bacterium]
MLTPQATCTCATRSSSSGETMLYHTLQHLGFTGSLKLHYEDVTVGRSRPRLMKRLFLSRGIEPAANRQAERFVWQLVPADRPVHLVELRRTTIGKGDWMT